MLYVKFFTCRPLCSSSIFYGVCVFFIAVLYGLILRHIPGRWQCVCRMWRRLMLFTALSSLDKYSLVFSLPLYIFFLHLNAANVHISTGLYNSSTLCSTVIISTKYCTEQNTTIPFNWRRKMDTVFVQYKLHYNRLWSRTKIFKKDSIRYFLAYQFFVLCFNLFEISIVKDQNNLFWLLDMKHMQFNVRHFCFEKKSSYSSYILIKGKKFSWGTCQYA